MLEPNCVCVRARACVCVCASVLVCVLANYTVVNIDASLMFLLAGKVLSKRQKNNFALKSPDVAQAVTEAEFLPSQEEPSPTNKPLNGSFDNLDIPYIDAEEEEDDDDEDAIKTKIVV